MEVVRRPRGRCLRRRLLLQERREHTTTSPGVVPQNNLFHHSQWNLGTGEIIQCVNTTSWPLPRQWYLLATKTGCVFKTRFSNSSNFTWIASVATTVTRHAKRLEAEIENLSIVQQHEHIAGVVFLQNCSAAQPAQSWSDIIQHGLRPQPSFARFLGLPQEIHFPIWTSIRRRDASLVAPVHSYFRSAHSGVGEASPHGYTFPAPVRTHRMPILTIPALQPIVPALASIVLVACSQDSRTRISNRQGY